MSVAELDDLPGSAGVHLATHVARDQVADLGSQGRERVEHAASQAPRRSDEEQHHHRGDRETDPAKGVGRVVELLSCGQPFDVHHRGQLGHRRAQRVEEVLPDRRVRCARSAAGRHHRLRVIGAPRRRGTFNGVDRRGSRRTLREVPAQHLDGPGLLGPAVAVRDERGRVAAERETPDTALLVQESARQVLVRPRGRPDLVEQHRPGRRQPAESNGAADDRDEHEERGDARAQTNIRRSVGVRFVPDGAGCGVSSGSDTAGRDSASAALASVRVIAAALL